MSKENGRFEKGNEIGKATRFKKKNRASVKYKDDYCDKILKYFAEPPSEIVYERSYYKDGTLKSEKPIILPPKFPTFELFAASIGVVPNTLLNWCDKHPRFADCYAQAKNMQLGIAKTNGVKKLYDSNFTKFILMNDHGMSEKVTNDNTVTFQVQLSDEVDEESN